MPTPARTPSINSLRQTSVITTDEQKPLTSERPTYHTHNIPPNARPNAADGNDNGDPGYGPRRGQRPMTNEGMSRTHDDENEDENPPVTLPTSNCQIPNAYSETIHLRGPGPYPKKRKLTSRVAHRMQHSGRRSAPTHPLTSPLRPR